MSAERELLESIEAGLAAPEAGEAWPALLLVAARSVGFDEEALRASLRRAVLLLAAGGDPQRGLEPDGRAVTALASDLWAPARLAELRRGLESLQADSGGLPRVEAELDRLTRDAETTWRLFACVLLADELAQND